MKGDFSRNSFDPDKHYRGVRMQQGRVQMDADWNEQIDITDHRDRLFTDDFLGDAIGPSENAGFLMGVTSAQPQDLTIGLGRYYVDGLLVENSSSLYYTQQTDYPHAVLPNVDGVYLAYLEVWQRSLSMTDDVDMTESALGGVDTATRVYTVAQVKLMPVDDKDIPILTYNNLFNTKAEIDSAAYNNVQHWNAMTTRLPAIANEAQLLPDVTSILTTDTTYRIQIHQGGNATQATYKTSTDNPLLERTIVDIDTSKNTITLNGYPPAGQPALASGQWLELSTEARDSQKMPGDMVQITAASPTSLVITISGAISADIVNAVKTSPVTAIARRWQKNVITIADSSKNSLENGPTIHFLGNSFANGSYWTVMTNTKDHTINWPTHNGQFIALPSNSTTVSQLQPKLSNSTLQNQLYRVEIHQSGDAGKANFKWSRDNASISSRISSISGNNITLTTLPQDGINSLMMNQWLELTTPARELTGTPGDMVQITAVNGTLLTVAGSIGADITVANNATAQRWDTAANSSADAVNTIVIDTSLPVENGLSVIFSGSDFRTGDYWLIPARAATNSQGSHIDWPMDNNHNYLTQQPQGIQRSYAPLAIVQRSGGQWSFENDARTLAIPLSDLNVKVIGADPCAPADTIHVDCNGQVGISTDIPQAKLDVVTNPGMTNQDAIHATAVGGCAASFSNNSEDDTIPTLRVSNSSKVNGYTVRISASGSNAVAAGLWSQGAQPTLYLHNSGSGVGINALAESGYAAVFVNHSTTNPTVFAENDSHITAAFYNNSTTQPALYVQNKIDHSAGVFINESAQPTVSVENTGSGDGILGKANGKPNAIGVHGTSTDSVGVWGDSTNYVGVVGTSTNNFAIYAESQNSVAIWANSGSSTGPTMVVKNTGDGNSLEATAGYGYAAFFTNSSSTLPTLHAGNDGDNVAAAFFNSSAKPTLYILNNGSGDALEADGNATINGHLSIGNTNSGSFSLTPVANKIPVADQSGHINAGWLPTFVTPTQLQAGTYTYCNAKGSVNAWAADIQTTDSAPIPKEITVEFPPGNTGLATLNVNGEGAKPIINSVGNALYQLSAYEIAAGSTHTLQKYTDPDAWYLIQSNNPKRPVAKTSLAKSISLPSIATDSLILYDSIVSDPYHIFSNSYSAVIPTGLEGTWRITTGNIATDAGPIVNYLYIRKNGVVINTLGIGTGTVQALSGVIELDLLTGDTIQISVLNNSLSAIQIVGGVLEDIKNGSYFQLSYVGPSTAVPV